MLLISNCQQSALGMQTEVDDRQLMAGNERASKESMADMTSRELLIPMKSDLRKLQNKIWYDMTEEGHCGGNKAHRRLSCKSNLHFPARMFCSVKI